MSIVGPVHNWKTKPVQATITTTPKPVKAQKRYQNQLKQPLLQYQNQFKQPYQNQLKQPLLKYQNQFKQPYQNQLKQPLLPYQNQFQAIITTLPKPVHETTTRSHNPFTFSE